MSSEKKLHIYQIKALDFLSFGGLQNFSAGESSFRSGKFPPEISRFFHLINLEKHKVISVLLLKDKDLFFPIPADWAVPRKGEEGDIQVNQIGIKNWEPEGLNIKEVIPTENEEVFFDDERVTLERLPYLEETKDEVPKKEGTVGWVSFKDIKPYFKKGRLEEEGNPKGIEKKELSQVIKKSLSTPELKVGLTLNKGKFTAEESRLYFEFVDRLLIFDEDTNKVNKLWKETSLIVLVLSEEDNPIKEGFYYIGGETRVGNVKKLKNLLEFIDLLKSSIEIKKGNLYKLYLLSHTFIKDGMQIENELHLKDLNGTSAKFKVKWIFTSGREWLSGFNKPAIEVLKPGTVLVLEKEKPDEENKKGQSNGENKNLTRAVFIEQNVPKVINEWFKEQPKKLNFEKFHQYGYNFGLLIPIDK
jgi:CRISPR-associated protein Cmr3